MHCIIQDYTWETGSNYYVLHSEECRAKEPFLSDNASDFADPAKRTMGTDIIIRIP